MYLGQKVFFFQKYNFANTFFQSIACLFISIVSSVQQTFLNFIESNLFFSSMDHAYIKKLLLTLIMIFSFILFQKVNNFLDFVVRAIIYFIFVYVASYGYKVINLHMISNCSPPFVEKTVLSLLIPFTIVTNQLIIFVYISRSSILLH